ncbi:hypothetical protein L195_g016256 [Trifolium pratense]|uniref:Uncharacterized protein n=2 Tax=Trifolium pratense TaxID=57577 RepID=A0ACB0LQ17_TRIPR|nr:hypothetical protein L195_g016256 [Trifolium pratense]CAJ2669227.1 unnamed protein product [Trifolium pratense]
MDSFKHIWGAPEGCSSSESGWTMYIDSPMQEDDARCSNENDGYNYNHHEIYGEKSRRKKKVDEDQESDDSMASDASSGPTNYQSYARGGQGSQGRSVSKKDHKQDHGSKSCSKKNGNKQEKKRVDSRSKK